MNQPLAYIHPNARIAEDVKIEAFAWIGEDVEIGSGTWIGPNATIMDGARIGKNCKIFPGAVISAIPQDLKYQGETTYCYIGDGTTVRESATVNKGTSASGKTVVGKDCLLMAFTHVAHDCYVGDHVIMANAATLAGHITVDDWAIFGGLAAVSQFCRIGSHVMICGGSLGQQGHSAVCEDGAGLSRVLCWRQFHRIDASWFYAPAHQRHSGCVSRDLQRGHEYVSIRAIYP